MKHLVLMVVMCIIFFPSQMKINAKSTEVSNVEELAEVIRSMEEDTTINLSKSFPKNENIMLSIALQHNLIIDGMSEVYNNKFQLKIVDEGNDNDAHSVLHFRNFHFDGEKIGVEIDAFNSKKPTSEVGINIENATFKNSEDTVIKLIGSKTINENKSSQFPFQINLNNVEVSNNNVETGPAIISSYVKNMNISNSIIENNQNTSGNLSGGAINITGENVDFKINQTDIVNNSDLGDGNAGAGAIVLKGQNMSFSSEIARFHKNKVTKSSKGGGAISIITEVPLKSGSFVNGPKVRISKTTFSNNSANDRGGAIFMSDDQNQYFGGHLTIDRSLFYSNSSANGGSAIFIEPKIQGVLTARINATTIYNNYVLKEGKGGAIETNNVFGEWEFSNSVLGKNKGKSGYENLYFSQSTIKQIDTMGIDNGVPLEFSDDEVFGIYPIKLSTNRGTLKVGTSSTQRIVPSISVIPKFTSLFGMVTTGRADLGRELDLQEKEKSDLRGSKPDYLVLGSVSSTSIIYDANEGHFNLPQLDFFDGEKYYEGTSPKQYGELFLPKTKRVIRDGEIDLNVTRAGHIFMGWSVDPRALKPDSDLMNTLELAGESQVKLFAVWRERKYFVKYFGNGNTVGTAPNMMKVLPGMKVQIKKENTLKRKGYKFKGWLKNNNKLNKVLKPDIEYTVNEDSNFYAIWERENYQIKYYANGKINGLVPKSSFVNNKKIYSIKKPGLMKRKGYHFIGWSLKRDVKKADFKYEPGKKVKITKDLKLYAIWKKSNL